MLLRTDAEKAEGLAGKSGDLRSGAAWSAMLARDRSFDGKFVYAAVTTGIYCRPSCPSRRPHRRNILLFPTAKDAEHEGFVACRRCCPASNSLTLAEKSIEAVLKYIDGHFNQRITLDTLSQITGLSPNHLQQTFKRIVGISPKAFCDFRRLAHFKQFLKVGESISSAGYGAGYGSSRALYEKSKNNLGMTPAAYQRGGQGVRICYSLLEYPSGNVLIAGTESGVCAVFVDGSPKSLVRELRKEYPKASIVRETPRQDWAVAIRSSEIKGPLLSHLAPGLRKQVFHANIMNALSR